MIDQLTVLLGNKKGRLTALCDALGKANIQMHALAVADTSEYGVVRIICDDPQGAVVALTANGFTANVVRVLAVQIPDVPGGAAQVFDVLEKADASIEYAYCFTSSVGAATLAVKTDKDVKQAIEAAGFHLMYPKDLYTA